MTEKTNSIKTRPVFPKRVIITAGMPYGNKDLHIGHIGGVFIHADIFARFLRDRIGRENVIFISGTDCYGSPIVEYFRQVSEAGNFTGKIEDFVKHNHKLQKQVLDDYQISLNLYAASSFGRSAELHKEICSDFFMRLYENNHLLKLETKQFYDPQFNVFLNGRQVEGRCPIEGCASEKGYADECSLGHQYDPQNLLDPKSTLSGKKPEMRTTVNWYFNLPAFKDKLTEWIDSVEKLPYCRQFVVQSIREFFEPPTVHVLKKQMENLESIRHLLPCYTTAEGKSKSVRLVFNTLKERETACEILTSNNIRFRTGKTLVPFRLSGNITWGLPVPVVEGIAGLTFWVWPESLWAPISFTATYLESLGRDKDEWKKWWTAQDTEIFQFIGEDNIYFYGIAEMAMFMAMQDSSSNKDKKPGAIRIPKLIVNNHILFLDKKASSSGKIKPPMARDLFDYYTSDQLRAHFFSLGIGMRSVSFRPKPLDPNSHEKAGDPVMKEGNLLSNVFNRVVRSAFYTMQKYFNDRIPSGEISKTILQEAKNIVLQFENLMYGHEFHKAMAKVDAYIRNINKYWNKNMSIIKNTDDSQLMKQTLIDMFYMIRIAAVLMHPVAPRGTEMIREYLNVGREFWDGKRIFQPIEAFMDNPQTHKCKFLAPRVDFFEKHPSQYEKSF